MIFKIFSMCNHILVLDHFPDNSVFFKSCVVGGLIKKIATSFSDELTSYYMRFHWSKSLTDASLKKF